MKKVIIGTSILLFFLLLAVTNPNEAQFQQHLEKEFRYSGAEKGGMTGALDVLFADHKVWMSTTRRKNCWLFSIYNVQVPSERHVYLGILGGFFQVR